MAEIPDPVDLAVICVPGEHVLGAAEDALARAFAHSASSPRDSPRSARRASSARTGSLPSCARRGADDRPELPWHRLRRHPLERDVRGQSAARGSIGFSSQSGALGLALIEAADARGIGLSAFVSIGNKADVSSNDLLERFEDDESTNLIALYLESFGNPRKFARIARRVARTKPILALKSGATARAKARGLAHGCAHEFRRRSRGALPSGRRDPGRDARGARGRIGLCCRSTRCPLGRRVAVLTNAGGLGILAADACEAAGLELPTLADESGRGSRSSCPSRRALRTPSTCSALRRRSTYEAVLPVLLEDRGVDAVLVLFVPPVTATAPRQVALAVTQAARARRSRSSRP